MSDFSLDLPSSTWRLLTTGLCDGVANMAIDEAILLSVAAGTSPPTLRFYGWKPPCVSVGYAQPLRGKVDLDACRALGYTWVRRPTGGRAVLHIDELTYSVAAPQTDPRVAGDILTSYRRLSLALVSGLRLLGCDATQAARQQDRDAVTESAACFDVPAPYEVTALGRKLVGSAQVRRRGVVLQHGSLPLTGDVSRLADVLSLPAHGREELCEKLCRRAIALDQALGRAVSWAEAAAALAEGFIEALNLRLEPGGLSSSEKAEVDRLQTLYAGDEWMFGSS